MAWARPVNKTTAMNTECETRRLIMCVSAYAKHLPE